MIQWQIQLQIVQFEVQIHNEQRHRKQGERQQ